MLSVLFPLLAAAFLSNPAKQTAVIFDDYTVNPSSKYYATQTCTNVRTETCCEPLSLQVEGVPAGRWWHGWFRANRVIYTNLPVSHKPSENYLAVFTYEEGEAACRGRLVDVVYLKSQRTWGLTYAQYPYLTGGAYLSKEESVALMYNVYPDIVTYQGINYTDENRGDGIYKSTSGEERIIYGVPMFRTSH